MDRFFMAAYNVYAGVHPHVFVFVYVYAAHNTRYGVLRDVVLYARRRTFVTSDFLFLNYEITPIYMICLSETTSNQGNRFENINPYLSLFDFVWTSNSLASSVRQ